MGLLQDRVVLVSGVGPGLGRETAAAVLREGGRVVAIDMVGDRVAAIAAELDPDGERTLTAEVDITSAERCAALPALVDERFGRLDGVVNVAAVDTAVGGLMDDEVLDDWQTAAAVNVEGTLRLTRTVVPLLQRTGGGSIVTIASTAFARPRRTRWNLAYAMSKSALVTSTYYLAEELGPDNIRTNTVAPGWKYGPVVEGYFDGEAARQGVTREELMAPIIDELALPHMTTDGDVANAAVFFLSDLARSVSGQTLFVDSGHVFR
ncbi:MAG TPA: SDR family oxidoreductase [Acidimicrobiales bacterium]|nr:SDR family oxidoreductase [Acidimicrobiales bacterium]